MKSWLEFEERFRGIAPSLQYQRIDFQWGTDGEYWQVCGGAVPSAARRFSAIAMLSGIALLEAAKIYSELETIVSKENEPEHVWYRALKELTGEFKMSPIYFTDENRSPKGNIFIGSIENICEVSANLCLVLHGRYPLPEKEVLMSEVNITNSTIGVLNTGQMNNIKSIAVNIGKLNDSGLKEVAAAINALADAVAVSTELTDELRSSTLDQLESLSQQALLPEKERMKRGVLKALGTALSLTLSAVGGLAEIWSTWGPAIQKFIGL